MADDPDGAHPSSDPAAASPSETEVLIEGLGEIQRRGLRAATELVDALLGALDREAPRSRSRLESPGEDARDGSPGLDLASLLATVTDAANGSMLRADGLSNAPGTVEVDGADPVPDLRLVVSAVGASSTEEIVLRNPTTKERTDLVLHAGELRSSDGAVLGGRLRFDPESIDVLPARSSRGVRIVAALDDDVAAGTYLGVILVRGLPGAWITVAVVVMP